jgi:hypothetical protein
MSTYETPTKRRPLAARSARGPRLAVLAAGTVVASVTFLAGCTAAKSTATSSSSALASGAVSSGASAPASSAAASSAVTSASALASPSAPLPSPVSSAAPSLVANIEAPATKAGFKIRVHRGSILKVDAQQPKAGTPITFTLIPASAQFITPIAGANGYFTAASDGVVNVSVSQGGAAIGTLSVTVWG